MIAAAIQFIVASSIVVIAAIVLTRFSDQIARITGLGHLIVGSVLLAAATSLPELSVNLAIINLDLPNMAIGGLIGSSLFNLGILGIADLSNKTRGAVFSRKAVESALPGVASISLTAVVGIGIFVGGRVGAKTEPLEFQGEYVIYYAWTELYFEKATEAWIAVGSDDRSDLWINDVRVWSSSDILKAWRIDEGMRKVRFEAGMNDVLCRIENGNGPWAFSLSINLENQVPAESP